jgi:transcriptional regulator with GAF, ATPase, and Fis domain
VSHAEDGDEDDLLARTFVELADSLVHDFDVVSFLQTLSSRCVGLFDVGAAGVMLLDSEAVLRVVASSDEFAHTLELMELQNEEGPCLDAFRTSKAVQARQAESVQRWPRFTEQAHSLGYQAFTAVPLRLRSQTIGALNLFGTRDLLLGDSDMSNAQALADIATIGLINERTLRQSQVVAAELQHALTSRVHIEQAKGFLSVKLGCGVDEAFIVMRDYCRDHNLRLADVARAVVAGDVPADAFTEERS